MDKSSQQSSSSCDGSITDQEKSSDIKTGNDKSTFDFSERTWTNDFALIVEGEKLFVSKAVLALLSPVFNRMFQSDFREKDQAELNLPGKKVREMRDFLRSVYPGMSECISDENVYKLLPLAEEYQVTTLIAKCERFLISRLNKELTADDTKMMLQTAVIYNMEDLLVKLCEELPEQSARDIISAKILLPSTIVPKILDKLMGRLDQVREQKLWYESIYNYLESGFSRTEQQNLEKYQGWKCKSIHLKLNVDDLKKSKRLQTTQFEFLNIVEKCKVSVYSNGSLSPLYVDISFDNIKCKTSKVTVHGRIVIRNVSYANENYKSTFEMEFGPTKLKQTATMISTSDLFSKTAGYMHYNYMDAKVHLLAKIQKVQ